MNSKYWSCPLWILSPLLLRLWIVVAQSQYSVWLCHHMKCSTSGFPVLHYLMELAQNHVHWVGDAIQPSYPLLSPFPRAINLSQHQDLFQWVSASHQVARVLEVQLHHLFFQWIFSVLSFSIDWLDLLAVQGTLKSHRQHHSLKASILWHSDFFMVQLSHLYMTTGKTLSLTRQTFLGKVVSC